MTNKLVFLFSITILANVSFAEGTSARRIQPAPEVSVARSKPTSNGAPAAALPPLPAGVESIKFSEFFKTPFGDYGPEFTDKLKSLDGKKVRILGFMVKEETSPDTCNPNLPKNRPSWMSSVISGRLMLCAEHNSVSMQHYALCDDLPAQTLYVTVPSRFGEQVPYAANPLLLTGTLSIGNKTEPDGRVSGVRLLLDEQTDAPDTDASQPLSMSSRQTETTSK